MAPAACRDQAEMLKGRKPTVGPMTAVENQRAAVISAGLMRWMVEEKGSS
jgi:hypothetical protein